MSSGDVGVPAARPPDGADASWPVRGSPHPVEAKRQDVRVWACCSARQWARVYPLAAGVSHWPWESTKAP